MSDLARARALCDVGRYADALPFAQRAIAGDPADVDAHCLLALVLYRLDRFSDSLSAAERGMAHDPNHEWPHRLRALALLGLEKNRPALAAAREATRLAADVPETHYALVQAELANGRLSDANRSAQRCLTLDPDSALGHNALALVMLQAKKWRDAEQACRRALAIDPEDVAARHNLGIAVSRQKGRAIEGVGHLTEASKLDPSDKLSREQAVAAGRRYVAGGVIGLYVLSRILSAGVRSWDDSKGLGLILLVVFVVIGGWLLLRRRRRLAELPQGVAELIRSRDRRTRRRTGQVLFATSLVVSFLGLVALVSEPRAGVFLVAAGVLLAVMARGLTVRNS